MDCFEKTNATDARFYRKWTAVLAKTWSKLLVGLLALCLVQFDRLGTVEVYSWEVRCS